MYGIITDISTHTMYWKRFRKIVLAEKYLETHYELFSSASHVVKIFPKKRKK